METIIIFSFIFSLIATGLSLVRILRTHKESKRKRQADLFLNVTNLVRIIEDEKFIQSRRALRKSKHLTQLKDGTNNNNNLIFEIDPATEEAARNVATTYDRLGFILKHDKELEDEFIQWQSYVIADMWLYTKDFVNKKWRSRNKNYLKEFERISQKALDNENIDKTVSK
ncbi:MAG TPA: hypothetical protein VFM31_00595 [Nitrososphaeraceae archaeon]|nr:hypothetical protein [Nitrososphaeraceae archaeon]